VHSHSPAGTHTTKTHVSVSACWAAATHEWTVLNRIASAAVRVHVSCLFLTDRVAVVLLDRLLVFNELID
jgi:hypothetical protein